MLATLTAVYFAFVVPVAPVAVKPVAQTVQIRALQQERRTVLVQIEQQIEVRYKAGLTTREEVIEATLPVVEADLELATRSADRIALREKTINLLRELESNAQQRVTAGVASQTELLKPRLRRIDAEIALAREKGVRP